MSTPPERPPVNANGNIVELRGVTVMQEDNIVLRDVNLSLRRGEFVYVIGRVGSGKTSLIKTLYADLPYEGEASFVLGYDLGKMREADVPYLRRRIGIVFQDFQLLSDRSVYDNLEFVLRATGWKKRTDIDKRIREVLAQVDMINKGYKRPHQLSGGEQQRVAIARALLNSPDLILADEPTGNLDPDTTVELMTLLRQINRDGKGVLMATHNHNVIDRFPARTLECENSLLFEHEEHPDGNGDDNREQSGDGSRGDDERQSSDGAHTEGSPEDTHPAGRDNYHDNYRDEPPSAQPLTWPQDAHRATRGDASQRPRRDEGQNTGESAGESDDQATDPYAGQSAGQANDTYAEQSASRGNESENENEPQQYEEVNDNEGRHAN